MYASSQVAVAEKIRTSAVTELRKLATLENVFVNLYNLGNVLSPIYIEDHRHTQGLEIL